MARSTFRSQNVQNTHHVLTTFGSRDVEKVHAVVARSTFPSQHAKNTKTHHMFAPLLDVQMPFCVAGAIQETRPPEMFPWDVRRSGRRFPERDCILEHQICRFATMILRDRCSTSYDLGSLFRGRRSILDRRSGKIAKRIGARPSPLLSTLHF